jgi:NTE family protein
MREGIQPEMLVGTSAGAVNAAFLATNPTLEGVHQLSEIWKHIKKEDIYPGGAVRMAWHLATQQDSLCSRRNLASFLQRNTPKGIRSFRQLKVPLYIVATDLLTGNRYLFGEDPDEHVVDAILASTAIPPFFPPWLYQGRLLVDGGVSDNLPIGVAVEKGAREIYALDVVNEGPPDDGHWNVIEVAAHSLRDLIHQQRVRDLSFYASYPGVNIYHLPLYSREWLPFDDFDHADVLIDAGREEVEAHMIEQKTSGANFTTSNNRRSVSHLFVQTMEFFTSLVSRFSLSSQS